MRGGDKKRVFVLVLRHAIRKKNFKIDMDRQLLDRVRAKFGDNSKSSKASQVNRPNLLLINTL